MFLSIPCHDVLRMLESALGYLRPETKFPKHLAVVLVLGLAFQLGWGWFINKLLIRIIRHYSRRKVETARLGGSCTSSAAGQRSICFPSSDACCSGFFPSISCISSSMDMTYRLSSSPWIESPSECCTLAGPGEMCACAFNIVLSIGSSSTDSIS